MSPWSFLASNLIALMAYLLSPENYLFIGLLRRIAILGFPNPFSTSIVLIRLGLIWWTFGLNYTSSGSCWWLFLFGLLPPHPSCIGLILRNKNDVLVKSKGSLFKFTFFIFVPEIEEGRAIFGKWRGAIRLWPPHPKIHC